VPRYGVPQLSDLRECKAIGMDADLVIFPYRPWYFSKSPDDKKGDHKEFAQIIIGKQRNGPVGAHPVYFIGDETRFESVESLETGLPRTALYSTAVGQHQPGYLPKHKEGNPG
jgi:replicative DNA helicase